MIKESKVQARAQGQYRRACARDEPSQSTSSLVSILGVLGSSVHECVCASARGRTRRDNSRIKSRQNHSKSIFDPELNVYLSRLVPETINNNNKGWRD